MQIKQWEDKHLAHYSYSILNESTQEMVLIDPSRNPHPYLDHAAHAGAKIIAVIETHPHADFVSSHLELHHLTGCTLYTHASTGADYPHRSFNEGDSIRVGKLNFTSIHTPGHSPDSICVLLEADGRQHALFTGDTLFIGDCGRPDLREGAGSIQLSRNDLADKLYHSLRDKIRVLEDQVLVYPAHGAGTLCGKNLSKESSSTIGREKQTNWCLQDMDKDAFVKELLTDQPFVPAYFSFDVEVNRKGAPAFRESLAKIPVENALSPTLATGPAEAWIVDTRGSIDFRNGHLPHSLNLMEDGKFETWLGSIIKPGETFILAGKDTDQVQRMLARTAAIGYEAQVQRAFICRAGEEKDNPIDLESFRANPANYTIVDVRNESETRRGKPFAHSINIPLGNLREKLHEIPGDKPVVVHCAGGYRSAAASSLIKDFVGKNVPVFDLGDHIREFMPDSH